MADRSTKVTLLAQVSSYVTNMEAAAKKTRDLGSAAEDGEKKLAAQREAMQNLGGVLLGFGALAAAGVAVAVKKFADFDQAMSQVKAATQESAENMSLLRDAALGAGADTVYSATEAANAIEEMGKAGVSTADILDGGLNGALSLAAAGNLEVGRAAEIAATAMNQFGLQGRQIPHIADLLAAGAGKASGEVEDMAQALNQSGLVANQMGLSIEETTGTLTAFASAGLLGSDAGTSLKTMLQRLNPTSKEAAEEMKRLGLSAYDSAGNFVGMEEYAGRLAKAMGGLTDEQRNASMSIIFGSDAVRAASVIYENGAEGIGNWIGEVDQSGYAAKVAADRLDNLAGDVEKLGGAFDTFLIKSGSGANDMLRGIVQVLTGLVDVVGALPAPVLGAGLVVAGLAAAVALAGGAFLIAVPKVAQFKASLATMNMTVGSAARGIGLMSGALTIVGVGLSVLANRQAEATANTQQFKDSLDQTTGAFTDYTRELVKQKLAEGGAYETAKKAGVSQRELTDAVLAGGDALDKVRDKISGINTLGNAFDGTAFKAGFARDAIDNIAASVDGAEEDFRDTAAAGDGLTESTDKTGEAFQAAADAAAELQENLTTLIDTVNTANGVNRDAVSANAAWKEGLAGIGEQVEKLKKDFEDTTGSTEGFSLSLDENTLAGSQSAAMLADVAGKAEAAALAQLEVDKTTMGAKAATEKYLDTQARNKQAFIESAVAAGYNADEVKGLADRIFQVPEKRSVEIAAETAAASAKVAQFVRDLYNIPGRRDVVINQVVKTTGAARGVVGAAYADGGAITGPGGPRQDNYLIAASSGEHVLDAEDVRRMGGQAAVYRFRQLLAQGGVPRYADGGAVRYASARTGPVAGAAAAAPVDVRVYLEPSQGAERFVDTRIEVNGKRNELRLRNGVQR